MNKGSLSRTFHIGTLLFAALLVCLVSFLTPFTTLLFRLCDFIDLFELLTRSTLSGFLNLVEVFVTYVIPGLSVTYLTFLNYFLFLLTL